MEIISQDEAKLKIKEWLSNGDTLDIIKQKLADHGFVDIAINRLLVDMGIIPPPSIDSTPKVPLESQFPQDKVSEMVLSTIPTHIDKHRKVARLILTILALATIISLFIF